MSTLNDRRKTCRRCGHAWYSHTDSPVRCPSCGTYRWKDEPTVNTCSVCGHGNGCIKISMETDVPLSRVIETVRRSIGGNRNPRM